MHFCKPSHAATYHKHHRYRHLQLLRQGAAEMCAVAQLYGDRHGCFTARLRVNCTVSECIWDHTQLDSPGSFLKGW